MANTYRMGKTIALTSLLSSLGLAVPYNAMAAETLAEALKESTTKLSLRPRYERVDEDSATVDNVSEALTLQTRLTFTTGNFYDVSAVLEFDDVTALMPVSYNDGAGSGEPGPVIADPEGTEVNQAYLSYTGLESTDFRWGRQRILLDNQRFVGGVGWRQNEQTYDAFSVGNKSISNLSVFLARISNVNRIFGENSTANPGDLSQETYLLNLGYKVGEVGSLVYYYYDIDSLTAGSENLSNKTMGLRFSGATALSEVKLGYELEFAQQSESGDSTLDYSADYYHVGVSGTMSGFTLGIAQELLGADGTDGKFITPLATLHKFQGWADVFLITPAQGIKDTYLTFKAGLPWGMGLTAMYHMFESDEDTTATTNDFGTEIDVALDKKFSNGVTVLLKYADFSGEEGSGDYDKDVEKFWLMATYAI